MADIFPSAAAIEERADLGTGGQATWRFWEMELSLAEKEDREWVERGRKIVKRYRDERDANEGRTAKYNILWSNVEVLKPVLYGRTPKPDVSRRHKDTADPAATLGADILQRVLGWEDDIEELDEVMQHVVEDRLLPGRGVARVFYEYELGEPEEGGEGEKGEPEETESEESEEDDSEPAGAGQPAEPFQPVISERAPVRYVFWEDYRETPARTETEIWWKAYRSYLTREELTERFGAAKAAKVNLDYTVKGSRTGDTEQGPLADAYKKATVWEIWDKKQKYVCWHAKGYSEGPLDEQSDPLELPGFFPSPPALRATTSNEQRVPVADFVEYQDQAQELDVLTSRIDRLVRALKVAGVYAGSEKAVLQQLVDDGSENKLIPVEDWAGFAGDKGGLNGLIQWLPVEQIARVLIQLYDARERILRIIYQTTGIADILRGETNPSETLGAQQLKTQFATRRITRAQKDVARFARDLIRLRGAVMARHFSPATLALMSGLPEPLPGLPPPPPMLVPAPQQMPGQIPGGPVGAAAAVQQLSGSGGPPMSPGGAPAAPAAGGGAPGAPQALPMSGGAGGPPSLRSATAGVSPPVPGARLAPDGRHYVPDPRRPGKYLMVA
jgi:hypothetical protein